MAVMGKIVRWRRWRVRFRRALAPLRPVRELIQGPEDGEGTRGFSLIEVAIAVAASAVICSAIYTSLTSAAAGDPGLRVRVDLQLDASRVMKEITDLLKSSETVDVWNDGTAPAAFANPGVVRPANAAEEGQGPSQEIALRAGADLLAMVLVPGPDGNELQLRRYGAAKVLVSSRVLARHVERITFEKDATSIRVTAWFRLVVDRKVYSVRRSSSADALAVGR